MTPDQFISCYNVSCFYHFTDIRNLNSIRQHGGLLRLSELRQRQIEIPAPGGNDWSHDADTRIGLDQYVHLCFFSEHPMEYRARQDSRIVESVFLQIDQKILNCEGIIFCPDVSNKSGVPRLTITEACEVMNFSVIYERTDWRDPKIQERLKQAKKYELLVPMDIPLSMIKRF